MTSSNETPDTNYTWFDVSKSQDVDVFYFYEREQLIVLWTLFFLIVTGNVSVMVSILLKHRKSRMNFFILQLAVSDLSVGLINVLTDIVWRMTVTWYAGNIACKLVRYFQAVVTYSSTYVLVALSIDRYDAIKHPLNFSGSWRRARILVSVAWLFSLMFSVPSLVLYEETVIQGRTQCWLELQEPWQWQVYVTIVAVLVFVTPTVVITICYTTIVVTVWSRSIIIRSTVFVVCWSPYIFFDLLQVYGYIARTQTNVAVATFVQSLAPLNSAANPLIYCLFSTRGSCSFRKCLPCCWLLGDTDQPTLHKPYRNVTGSSSRDASAQRSKTTKTSLKTSQSSVSSAKLANSRAESVV